MCYMKINVDTTPLLFFLVCNDTMLSDIWHTLLHHTHQSQFLAVCQVSAFCLLKKIQFAFDNAGSKKNSV